MKTKNYLALIAALFCFIQSHAQDFRNKGAIEIGGDFAFTSASYKGESQSTTLAVFTPYAGFMTGGGAEMGVKMAIAVGSGSYSSFAAYFAPAYNFTSSNNIVPYIEGVVGYASQPQTSTVSATGVGVGGSFGLKVLAGSCGIILIRFEYLHQNYSYTDSYNGGYYYNYNYYGPTTVNSYVNTIGFAAGFRLYFGGKAK